MANIVILRETSVQWLCVFPVAVLSHHGDEIRAAVLGTNAFLGTSADSLCELWKRDQVALQHAVGGCERL